MRSLYRRLPSFSAAAALCMVLCVCLAGCSSEKRPDGMPPLLPCEITIQQDGQPLSEASVSLVAKSGDDKWSAVGRTDSMGKAVLHTWGQYPGVPEGTYKVLVNKSEIESVIPPDASPAEAAKLPPDKTFTLVEQIYKDASSTPLEIELKKGTGRFTLDAGKTVRIQIQ